MQAMKDFESLTVISVEDCNTTKSSTLYGLRDF